MVDHGPGDKEALEYLRIYVMVWQKIDIIWGMFITSYIPLFGFLHFYPGQIGWSFAALFVVAIGGFTVVNGSALRMHYDFIVTMGEEFRRLNRSFPDLDGALARHPQRGKRRLVLFTHGFAFAGFLWLMGERLGQSLCDGPSGWGCLLGCS